MNSPEVGTLVTVSIYGKVDPLVKVSDSWVSANKVDKKKKCLVQKFSDGKELWFHPNEE